MQKYALTEEHRAQLQPWAQKWIANAMSTKPMDESDRSAMREAIRGLYKAAGLTPPPDHRIVFVPSPFVMRFAGGFAAAVWWLRKNAPPATRDATRDATEAATRDATEAATRDATRDATEAATRDATWVKVDLAGICEIAKKIGGPQAGFLLKCAVSASNLWQGGNQWSGYDSYLSFFRHVAKLKLEVFDKWQHWENASLHGGPRLIHPEFCIVSDRPEILKVDEQNRPHCVDGPFCRWRDGSALYSVHGVRVPAWIIDHPEKITCEGIDAEKNAEIRRVMIERYGQARYLVDSGAKEIHKDDFGTLYRKDIPGDEALVMVKVVNSTPEPDGSFKDYFLRVHPELRPLLSQTAGRNQLGDPQRMTAQNAVASTFGLRGEEYAPALET
jgi:hypothetical protein